MRANRIDARIVDSRAKSVILLEMSCPWMKQKGDQELREDGKVCPIATGIEEAVSWISSETV